MYINVYYLFDLFYLFYLLDLFIWFILFIVSNCPAGQPRHRACVEAVGKSNELENQASSG